MSADSVDDDGKTKRTELLFHLVQLPKKPTANEKAISGSGVYIGAKRNNNFWKLEKSEWYFPEAVSLNEYHQRVLLNFSKLNVQEALDKKVLYCFCDTTKRCHGNVMIYVLLSKQPGYSPKPFHIFKSDASPFSNSYKHGFIQNGKTFSCLAHCYYYWLGVGKQLPQKCLDQIVNCESLGKVVQLWQKCIVPKHNANPCTIDKVCLMYELLCLKWDVCSSFRELCSEYSMNLLIQESSNMFWGKGSHGNSVVNYNGENMAGWLIMILCEEKLFQTDPKDLFHRLKQRVIIVTEGIINCAFLRGLEKALVKLDLPRKQKYALFA